MRCDYYNKTIKPTTTRFRCKAQIYGVHNSKNSQVVIKKISCQHNHNLYTPDEIAYINRSRIASISDIIKNESYSLFLKGFTCTEAFKILKDRYFSNQECPFERLTLKNYLYERLKHDQIRYKGINEIYNAVMSEKFNNKSLITKELKQGDQIKGFAFTFEDQVERCMF